MALLKDKWGKKVSAKCNCGCCYVEIMSYEDDEDCHDYFIDFYRTGNGNYLPFKQKFKHIKDILNNRAFAQELCMTKSELETFHKEIGQLLGKED